MTGAQQMNPRRIWMPKRTMIGDRSSATAAQADRRHGAAKRAEDGLGQHAVQHVATLQTRRPVRPGTS